MTVAAWRRAMAREWLHANGLDRATCQRFHVDRRRVLAIIERAEPGRDYKTIRSVMEAEDG